MAFTVNSKSKSLHVHSNGAVPTREAHTRKVLGVRGSARLPESRPGTARGREGAAGPAPPRLVPLPRPAGHSRIFTRRWSRRAAAACRASRRRCSPAVRWPSAAAWPRPSSARGARAHPTQRKSPGSGGAPRGSLVAPAAGRRRGGREGRTDGRAGGRAARQRSLGSRGEGLRRVGAAAAWHPAASSHRRGARAARREEVRGAAPGRGARWPRWRVETGVPLKFAGRQERAGGSFPPSRLEREEEAGEVPPTPGEREGRRKKGKGEEKRAGPGNHLRLSRPPRPAPEGSWRPRVSALRAAAGTAAQSRGSHVAASLPSKAHGCLGRAIARPRGPARRGVERSEGAAEAEAPGTARRTPLGCSPALRPPAAVSRARPAALGTPRGL
ncbi:translation initiation factor IF-2 [Ailuropoda melanoleuca]|uniref:translation initiation factor IF-2 n=1 Tax=Ailuropoda melanoleuca TaxID=9646 RepID=UPI0014945A2B|nr:translation initiation factor IF-2 [Ailuropoda melanoleuca]